MQTEIAIPNTGTLSALLLWIRRWMVTWTAFSFALASGFDVFWLAVGIAALVLDFTITPRAVDLRTPNRAIIDAIRDGQTIEQLGEFRSRYFLLFCGLACVGVATGLVVVARILAPEVGNSVGGEWRLARAASCGIALGVSIFASWYSFELIVNRRVAVSKIFNVPIGEGSLRALMPGAFVLWLPDRWGQPIAVFGRFAFCLILIAVAASPALPLSTWRSDPESLQGYLLAQAVAPFVGLFWIPVIISRLRVRRSA